MMMRGRAGRRVSASLESERDRRHVDSTHEGRSSLWLFNVIHVDGDHEDIGKISFLANGFGGGLFGAAPGRPRKNAA